MTVVNLKTLCVQKFLAVAQVFLTVGFCSSLALAQTPTATAPPVYAAAPPTIDSTCFGMLSEISSANTAVGVACANSGNYSGDPQKCASEALNCTNTFADNAFMQAAGSIFSQLALGASSSGSPCPQSSRDDLNKEKDRLEATRKKIEELQILIEKEKKDYAKEKSTIEIEIAKMQKDATKDKQKLDEDLRKAQKELATLTRKNKLLLEKLKNQLATLEKEVDALIEQYVARTVQLKCEYDATHNSAANQAIGPVGSVGGGTAVQRNKNLVKPCIAKTKRDYQRQIEALRAQYSEGEVERANYMDEIKEAKADIDKQNDANEEIKKSIDQNTKTQTESLLGKIQALANSAVNTAQIYTDRIKELNKNAEQAQAIIQMSNSTGGPPPKGTVGDVFGAASKVDSLLSSFRGSCCGENGPAALKGNPNCNAPKLLNNSTK